MILFLPSRRRLPWLLAALVLAAAAVYAYWRSAAAGGFQSGGSPTGLGLGFFGLGLILLLLLFGWRKRAYKSRLGTLDGWLQAHVYLGFLSLLVVLLHAAFHLRDPLAVTCFVLLALVVGTGLVGAVLYTVLPARLTQVESKTSLEGVSEQLNRLHAAMAQLAAGRSPAFLRLYQKVAASARPGPLAAWQLLWRGAGNTQTDDRAWQSLLALVDEGERGPLRQLLVLARQHRDLHQRLRLQQHYQNLLAAWLYLHLPLSLLLLVATLAHALIALWFRGV